MPVLLSLCLAVAATAADWPSWRGPERNGISRETGWTHTWPSEGPPILWKAGVGIGFSSMVVADQRLIASSDKGELSVVRASPDRYELLARCQPLGGKCWTAPALAGGRLYLRNARGDLVCLDLNPQPTGIVPANRSR
ncbi:MAG: hypothetical protein J0L84_00140 [Verrucomicrobia bacterium]|nr:hypothetical protein [Verrucomicrobiota bacterium]